MGLRGVPQSLTTQQVRHVRAITLNSDVDSAQFVVVFICTTPEVMVHVTSHLHHVAWGTLKEKEEEKERRQAREDRYTYNWNEKDTVFFLKKKLKQSSSPAEI